ncbi:MAG: FAD-binding oxidoreductase [Caldilineaceae bacterium]
MASKESIFWWETTTIPTAAPEPPAGMVDVAVIGGGINGLSAAYALAKQGVKVAVLEAQSIGWGASSRNGGMVLTGLRLGVDTLLARYGRERAQAMFAASVKAIDYIEQLIRTEQIECDFVRCGHLEVACKPAHFKHFAHIAELSAQIFNHPVRLLTQQELHSEIGSDLYHGGLVDELSASVNPARYVAGLARAAQKAGAKLYEYAAVQRVEREGAAFRLATLHGTLRADKVFAGTGGYTGPATPALRKKLFPVGSYIIVTEPISAEIAQSISPQRRMMFDSKNFLSYFRLIPAYTRDAQGQQRMLFGGRAAFYPETPARVRASAEITRRGMIEVFPQLRNVRVDYVWGGTLDISFDRMPHVGQIDGLYHAIGYAGHGVALSTYLGAQTAEIICGKAADSPFAAIPFPGAPLGLYDGRPWFLPFAEQWYHFLDWIR